jgi:excisionase family DNA binding protein
MIAIKFTLQGETSMDLLTISEVAETLKVSQSTVRRMILKGEMVAFKVGTRGQLRVEKLDLERYLFENRFKPTENPLDDDIPRENC